VTLTTVIVERTTNRVNVVLNNSAGESNATVGPFTSSLVNNIRTARIRMFRQNTFTPPIVYTLSQYRNVAAHEFGHILGIGHPPHSQGLNVMNALGRPVTNELVEYVIRAYVTGTNFYYPCLCCN